MNGPSGNRAGPGPRAPFDDPVLVGLREAEARYGSPVRYAVPGILTIGGPAGGRPFARRRRAEIVLVLPRPGGVLLHTKAFYPAGALRLPTGGVDDREDVVAAARRELWEETGLRIPPTRFLFHVLHRLEVDGRRKWFHSLGFLFPETANPVAPTDPDEQITELPTVSWDRLPAVVETLEHLDPEWSSWGRFRGAPHRILIGIRRDHPDWFSSGP